MSSKLYIVIPAYNEERNIVNCIKDWYPVVERYNCDGQSRLFIVDDGSTDDTAKLLSDAMKNRPLLQYHTKKNGGHGAAVLYGYRYAIDQGADFIFQTDSDGQTDPKEFEGFWDKRDDYDAVIGERLKRGDGRGRKFVENVVCILLRIIFGVKTKDANAPFRLMKSDKLKEYIDMLPQNFNIPNIMLTAFYLYFGNRVMFIPISFSPRKEGKTSIDMSKMIKIGIKAIVDFCSLNSKMRQKRRKR
ncbi:MAG: glycosyltransferase family 2 protein [Lachnospiraceae bacterium]|nr:glycosyltransferase family 2 protein [Lachnospiraceae bacterium]